MRLALALVALASMNAGCAAAREQAPDAGGAPAKARGADPAVGTPIGDFRVQALAGDALDPTKTLSPRAFVGRPLLIDVWATWCKACVAAMPWLQDVHERYGDRISILSISIDEDPRDVAAFRARHGHEMPWLHAIASRPEEQDALFAALLGTSSLQRMPLYILVGADGVIAAATPDLVPKSLASHIDALLVLPPSQL